jgi:hypothetical protein
MGIVWILGAGFSKALGGPLLGKLLSPEADRDIKVRYGNAPLWTPAANVARFLYRYGLANKKRNSVRAPTGAVFDGEDLWEDAEQFLDYLDTAAESANPGRVRLLEIVGDQKLLGLGLDPNETTIKKIARAARKLLVAECSAFLEGANPLSERWSPYRRWLEQVATGDDIIVTFNYDLVVETIQRTVDAACPGQGAALLKLHGSVAWTFEGAADLSITPTTVVDWKENVHGALLDEAEPAIAAPGPSKQRFSHGLFENAWSRALTFLRAASAIVFIGYRFPPTDGEARQRLLGAIRENPRQYLPIHTVLGPNTASDDSRRLHGLLAHACSTRRFPLGDGETAETTLAGRDCYTIRQQPLWAEDFLSVVERGHILRPDKAVP